MHTHDVWLRAYIKARAYTLLPELTFVTTLTGVNRCAPFSHTKIAQLMVIDTAFFSKLAVALTLGL